MTAPPPPDPRPTGPRPSGTLRSLWAQPYFRLAAVLLVLAAAWWLSSLVRGLLWLTLTSYLIAFLVEPLLIWLARHRIGRPLGILLVVVLLLGALVIAGSLLGTIGAQLYGLVSGLPALADSLQKRLTELSLTYPALVPVQQQLDSFIQNITQNLTGNLGNLLSGLLSPGRALLLGAAGLLGNLVLVVTISIYMMANYASIGTFLLRLVPERWQPLALNLGGHVSRAMGGYFRGQLLVALSVGGIVTLGLLAVGLPSALAIGFLAAILSLIPFLGIVIATLPALMVALPLGWIKVLLVGGVFFITNQVSGNIVTPRVLGRSTNLSSLAVLLAITFGAGLFGAIGALLGVPVVALIKSLLEEYYYPSRVYRAEVGSGK
jgi:predicted PurR-regulated permease PerM